MLSFRVLLRIRIEIFIYLFYHDVFYMKPLSLFKGWRKKGQIGIPNTVLAGVGAVFGLFLIGVFVFAFAIAGAEMQDATTDATAIDVINQTVAGASAFANFSPVLWIITGIGILIGLLLTFVGGFLFVQNVRR